MNDRGLQRLISSLIKPIQRRVMMTVGRAVLRAIDDSASRQTAQIEALKGEVRDAVERMQEYGFTSVPLAGADAAVVFVAGNREQGIIIATEDRRYRLTGLTGGEVAIYDDQGQKVHLTRTGIVVDGGGLPVTIQNAPTVIMDGDLQVAGSISAGGDVSDVVGSMNEMRTVYNSHVHGGSPGPTPTMT